MDARPLDPARVDELIERESAALAEKQPRSIAFAKRASSSLAGGVACSWHALDPHTIYGARGEGSTVFDLDGNAFADFHLGFGVMAVGHAHPKVVEAVRARVGLGTHFALPVEDTVVVAELLAERFGLPLWRFKNSGSEATMDAVRIMRAATGRDLVVKVEGSYHGSADGLAFSYWPDPERMGPPERPNAVPNTAGVPEAYASVLRIVPYNDLPAVERVFAEEGQGIAGLILEPVLLNLGVILPEPGYLAGLREVTARHGAMLAFDEVKTGATIAYGGAVEWSGVTPDVVALAKAIGGGLPIGAIGGTEEAMRPVVSGDLEQEGTFNGNPLSMAAARAALAEILTREAYPRFEALNEILLPGLSAAIERTGLPARAVAIGARGCVHFRRESVRNLRDYLEADDRLGKLAWLFQLNRGVFEPGSDPWTISVAHTDADAARYVENFAEFADAVTA
jgi:glutamate-1-semialdehyde 2,1-aminomutase